MDWNMYLDKICHGSNNWHCSLWAPDGSSCYASSPDFAVTDAEAQAIQKSMTMRTGPIHQKGRTTSAKDATFTVAGNDFVCTVIDEQGGLMGTSKSSDEGLSVRALLQPSACLMIATQHDSETESPGLQMWKIMSHIQMDVGKANKDVSTGGHSL